MIIAVDFDDTLFEYVPAPEGTTDFSGRLGSIGTPIWQWILWCKHQAAAGHKLILWTCREGDALKHALEATDAVGLHFDAINANIPTETSHLWPDCRKVKADIYLDDKAMYANMVPTCLQVQP